MAVIGLMVLDSVATNPAVQANMPPVSIAILSQGENVMREFDWLIIMLTIGTGVASIASAALVRTHPILFIASFISQLVFISISFVFTNTYAAFASAPGIAAYANQFTLFAILLQNFPLILLFLSVLICIATYGKPGGQTNATV